MSSPAASNSGRQSGAAAGSFSGVTCGGTAWNSISRPVESSPIDRMPDTAIGGSLGPTSRESRGTSGRGLVRYHSVIAEGLPAFNASQRFGS